MTTSFFSARPRLYITPLLAVLICLVAACSTRTSKTTTRYRKLQQSLTERNASIKEMEDKTAKIQLRLLEKDAQIKELEDRMKLQQKMLDEAVQEVVRAKAKLRSLESKAEAASEMAEAEIALKALKVQLAGQSEDPEVIKAQQLLKMSAEEFEKENYGGALYLISQAKGHIRSSQMRLGDQGKIEPFEGEVVFAQPVRLQVIRNSNLREGPDLKSKVLTTLEKGTPLIGYSYKGQWVRVFSEDGNNGWIFQTLVSGR
jgi:uncharacterized protein YgiM (DUF1202 family)